MDELFSELFATRYESLRSDEVAHILLKNLSSAEDYDHRLGDIHIISRNKPVILCMIFNNKMLVIIRIIIGYWGEIYDYKCKIFYCESDIPLNYLHDPYTEIIKKCKKLHLEVCYDKITFADLMIRITKSSNSITKSSNSISKSGYSITKSSN